MQCCGVPSMLPTPSKHEVNNVDQNPAETQHILQPDIPAVETWLKGVWDRAKKAAEMISRLREEKAELQAKVASMEQEISRLRQDLVSHEEAAKSAPANHGDHAFLSNGDREQLTAKVKELLTKLDGYV